jgi:hypothetical protein
MEILTLGAIRQLCVVGSYLACAVARAHNAEEVAYTFESAAKGTREQQSFVVGGECGASVPPLFAALQHGDARLTNFRAKSKGGRSNPN